MGSSLKVFQAFIPFFSLFLCFSISYSQNQKKVDSLLSLLGDRNLEKIERVKILCDIAYYHTNLDSSLLYAKKSLDLAVEINSVKLQGEALEEISNINSRLGNTKESLKSSLAALKIYDSLGLKNKKAATYNQIAFSYLTERSFNSAIVYFKKANAIYETSKTASKVDRISTLINIGDTYRLIGHLDSAKVHFKIVLEDSIISNNIFLKGYTLGNLGMVYNAQDSLPLAKTNLDSAIAILRELGDAYATSVYLAELGEVYQKENLPLDAEANYLEALKMAQGAGLKEQIRDFSEKLTRFYEGQGQYSKALAYQKQFQVYQDSLVNKANIQEIERLKAGYEIDKRESEIGLLNQVNTNQKYLVWALSAGVLAILLFLYVLYRVNQRTKKANALLSQQKEALAHREQEKALLLKELNHRVKNNLQMISSLLKLQSRELEGHPAQEALETGKDRVEALSLVHRKLYQEGAETRIALKEYVEELVLGLFYGYEAPFEPEFAIEDRHVSIDTAIPLALIINELVVNALKYAYSGVENPAFLLKIEANDTHLIIEAMDNGKGFALNAMEKKNSFGLKLMDSLIDQLEGDIKKLEGKGTHWWVQLKVA